MLYADGSYSGDVSATITPTTAKRFITDAVSYTHLDVYKRQLPGDPHFDKAGGMEKVIRHAREDFLALQEGGVDAVMFSNEFSLPYLTNVKTENVAAMARVIGEIKPLIEIPYGEMCIRDRTCIMHSPKMRNLKLILPWCRS